MRALRLPALSILLLVALTVGSATGGVTFTEVGESAGIRFVHDSLGFTTEGGQNIQDLYGPGIGIEDINNDGWLDIFITNGGTGNRLFLNNGDWTFTDITAEMNVGESRVANGVAFSDLDNDGMIDFAVGNFYAQPQLYMHHSSRFVETADLMGLVPLIPGDGFFSLDPESMGVSFADFDHDGFLDIYVANYRDQQDVLYESRGGDFWQYNDSVQVTYTGYGFQAVFLDYDNDHDLDIYVANDFGYNFMFRNTGPEGGFALEEVALAHGIAGGGTSVHPKGMSMGLAVGDYDNDLDLDINVTNFQLNALYRNDGPGLRPGIWKWTEVASQLGVEYPINCWGTDFVDLDNDTDLDLVQASGYIYEVRFNQPYDNPDQVWLNNGPDAGYTFTNITEQSGFGSGQMARGLATGDLDRDGDVDVAIVNNTFYDPTADDPNAVVYEGYSQLYRNDQDERNNWVNLKLEGMKGRSPEGRANRSAVGARVELTTTEGLTMMREVQAGASFMSHNSLEVEFGLGQAEVERVRVRWPAGEWEEFDGVRANRFWKLTEGDGTPAALDYALVSFEAMSQVEGVRLEWRSAPNFEFIEAEVYRKVAGSDDPMQRLTDIDVEVQSNGGVVFDDTVVLGETYVYRILLRDSNGQPLSTAIAEVLAQEDTTPLPLRPQIGQNFPNPFNPQTRIQFSVPRSMQARVEIYDSRGRHVRTLFDGLAAAGTNNVDWDGRNDAGEGVASGVYTYALVTDDGTSARRMVLTR